MSCDGYRACMLMSGVRGNWNNGRTGNGKQGQTEGVSCYPNICKNKAGFLEILLEKGKCQRGDGG